MKSLLFLVLTLLAPVAASAADSLVFRLWPNGAPESNGITTPEVQMEAGRVGNVSDPVLIVYPCLYPNGTAVIMCPGGGYYRLAMAHEGTDMAQWFNRQSITYAVLKYRMPNGHANVPLSDAMQAMRIMRSHATDWGVKRIGIMGASAGGHLASTLATHYTADTRPDFQVLFYPVINMKSHGGSTKLLLGDNPADSLIQKFDNSLHVDSLTPPAFIMQSADDHTVGSAGLMAYYSALQRNKVPVSLHVYPTGGHGWGFSNSFKWKQDWTAELADWLSQLNSYSNNNKKEETDVQNMPWHRVALSMPESFYASKEAQDIADRVIFYQKPSGGWAKNVNYHFAFTPERMKQLRDELNGPTIDNSSTTQELKYLAHVYKWKHEKRWREAFLKGVEYMLDAQYANGGWPQYWPERNIDNGLDYSFHITYNDDAMVNVMDMLKAIYTGDSLYTALRLDKKTLRRCKEAFDKGVGCILATQIRVDGKPTVWCAQHDEVTLKPASARAYELPSFSGAESVGIVELLMNIDNPSDSVIEAVKGAINFFKTHEVYNFRTERFINGDGARDVRLVPAPGNVLWARFYDLDTQKPYFCGRDGVKRATLFDIPRERRSGYSWYTNNPQRVLNLYPKWLKKIERK